jgi:hypothetical protein
VQGDAADAVFYIQKGLAAKRPLACSARNIFLAKAPWLDNRYAWVRLRP